LGWENTSYNAMAVRTRSTKSTKYSHQRWQLYDTRHNFSNSRWEWRDASDHAIQVKCAVKSSIYNPYVTRVYNPITHKIINLWLILHAQISGNMVIIKLYCGTHIIRQFFTAEIINPRITAGCNTTSIILKNHIFRCRLLDFSYFESIGIKDAKSACKPSVSQLFLASGVMTRMSRLKICFLASRHIFIFVSNRPVLDLTY